MKLTKSSATTEKLWDVLCLHSCYVSRGMAVRKVSNSKSKLQGHSRAFGNGDIR